MVEQSVRYRTAIKSDAAPLSRFAEAIFRETFGNTNTEADMNIHCARTFGASRQLAEILAPDMSTILAEVDSVVVGFGQLRTGQAPACVQSHNPSEIYRLYVDSRWHGKEIAQQLMSLLLEKAFAAGADSVWLGVFENNPRAIAFYEKSGFQRAGEHTFTLGTDKQRDLVMLYRKEGRFP
jgi:ribosomal protein S18 acetylase RimI-like enzyme